MARYFIQHSVSKQYLIVGGGDTVMAKAKYSWTPDMEEATNLRYQVSAFRQLGNLRQTSVTTLGKGRCIVLKEEYKGKIFEVANLEIEV